MRIPPAALVFAFLVLAAPAAHSAVEAGELDGSVLAGGRLSCDLEVEASKAALPDPVELVARDPAQAVLPVLAARAPPSSLTASSTSSSPPSTPSVPVALATSTSSPAESVLPSSSSAQLDNPVSASSAQTPQVEASPAADLTSASSAAAEADPSSTVSAGLSVDPSASPPLPPIVSSSSLTTELSSILASNHRQPKPQTRLQQSDASTLDSDSLDTADRATSPAPSAFVTLTSTLALSASARLPALNSSAPASAASSAHSSSSHSSSAKTAALATLLPLLFLALLVLGGKKLFGWYRARVRQRRDEAEIRRVRDELDELSREASRAGEGQREGEGGEMREAGSEASCYGGGNGSESHLVLAPSPSIYAPSSAPPPPPPPPSPPALPPTYRRFLPRPPTLHISTALSPSRGLSRASSTLTTATSGSVYEAYVGGGGGGGAGADPFRPHSVTKLEEVVEVDEPAPTAEARDYARVLVGFDRTGVVGGEAEARFNDPFDDPFVG